MKKAARSKFSLSCSRMTRSNRRSAASRGVMAASSSAVGMPAPAVPPPATPPPAAPAPAVSPGRPPVIVISPTLSMLPRCTRTAMRIEKAASARADAGPGDAGGTRLGLAGTHRHAALGAVEGLRLERGAAPPTGGSPAQRRPALGAELPCPFAPAARTLAGCRHHGRSARSPSRTVVSRASPSRR